MPPDGIRYAFTGPSRLTAPEEERAVEVVRSLENPVAFITGAAHGWDTAVCLAALECWPDALHRIVTPGAPFNLAGVNQAVAYARAHSLPRFEVVTLPASFSHETRTTNAYRSRNERMVYDCAHLIAAVRAPTFYRSGEWMTVNIARRARVPVTMIHLGPLREDANDE